jgi:crossover junction endodeoxyribonuclease RusA
MQAMRRHWKDAAMITFTVEGTPRPQGSKRHVGNGIMVEASKHVANWRAFAKLKASQVNCERIEKPNPVEVTAIFYFDRPKMHFRSNGQLRADAPEFHTARPDGEKLMRALLDAITGICFHDDSQVAKQNIEKRYGAFARTEVCVSVLKLKG